MKRILVILLVFATVLMCFGCGEPPAEVESPKKRNNGDLTYDSVLTVFAHKPDTLCPILTKSESNSRMLQMVFDSLVSLNSDLTVEPCLATDWTVSTDGKYWTFNLRQDVKWHDGTPFEAKDVVYTVSQIKKNENSTFSHNVSNIAAVRKKGKFAVEFEVNEPWLNFANLLYFPIVKEQSDDLHAESFLPMGTGAYVFNNKKDDNEYHLLRNSSWWGGKPVTECITVRILADAETAMYAFGAGDIDIAMTDDINWGKFVDAETSAYQSVDSAELTFIGINTQKGALKNTEIRRAISYAVNRQQIVDEIMMSCGTVTTTPANPAWKISENSTFETKQDVEAAKKELEAGEWKAADGYWHKTVGEEYCTTVFTLLYDEDNPQREAMAQMIKQQLEAVGMDITLEKLPFFQYATKVQNGEYDLFVGSTEISPDLNFSFVLNDGNLFGYTNDEMNSMRASIRTGNVAEQAALYAPLIDKFHKECPIVSLFFKKNNFVYGKRVEGQLRPTVHDAYRGIETALKKEAN